MRKFLVMGSIAMVAVASADVIVPNAFAGTEAPSTFSLTSTSSLGRTYQYTISAAQLTGVVGQNLTGMTFRLGNGATAAWPPTNTSFTQWDIRVGAGVAPSAMSNTFASNFTGTPTLVRSGALSFNAGDFTFGATGTTPNAFGPNIAFNTNYLYGGGDLAVEMRFSAQAGATNQPAFDAVAATDTGNGWGTAFAGRWTGNVAGTTGGNANLLVTRFSSAAVPEPATMAVLGLGIAALLRRRRK